MLASKYITRTIIKVYKFCINFYISVTLLNSNITRVGFLKSFLSSQNFFCHSFWHRNLFPIFRRNFDWLCVSAAIDVALQVDGELVVHRILKSRLDDSVKIFCPDPVDDGFGLGLDDPVCGLDLLPLFFGRNSQLVLDPDRLLLRFPLQPDPSSFCNFGVNLKKII